MYSYISSKCVSLFTKKDAKNMNPLLAQAGGQAIGGAIGLGIQAINQEQQLRQAQKLQAIQIGGQKEMGKFNQELALDMWNKTNYEAQRKHMEAAGLNVGLMYGMGGGGGATTNTPTGNVQGQATHIGNEAGMGIMAGQNLAMTQAQIDLIKAQTEQTKVDTAKTAGVDTEEAKGRIENLKQVTNNAKIQEHILAWENSIKEIESNIAGATKEDIIGKVKAEYNKLIQEANIAEKQGIILEGTYKELIKQADLTSQKMGMELLMQKALIEQTETKTDLTKEEIELTKKLAEKYTAEITRMQEQTGQGWAEISQRDQEIAIKNTLAAFETNTAAKTQQWAKVIESATQSYRNIIGKK